MKRKKMELRGQEIFITSSFPPSLFFFSVLKTQRLTPYYVNVKIGILLLVAYLD